MIQKMYTFSLDNFFLVILKRQGKDDAEGRWSWLGKIQRP